MKKQGIILFALQIITFMLLILANLKQAHASVMGVLVWLALILTGLVGWYFIRPLVTLYEKLDVCIREDNQIEAVFHELSQKFPIGIKLHQIIVQYANHISRSNLAEVFDKQAELTTLQSQINPHFLYNTLESIRGQALIDDNDEIAEMVEALASFFRYSISRSGNLVTLRDELTNIANYMMIQCYRFNNRFSLSIDIEEDEEAILDQLIPKLSIQPIVENAIFHGLEEKMDGGTISIDAFFTETNFILTVSDNGIGMSLEALQELNKKIQTHPITSSNDSRKTGIGLPNINKRIALLFGLEYGLHVYSSSGYGTDVELVIPRGVKEVKRRDEE